MTDMAAFYAESAKIRADIIAALPEPTWPAICDQPGCRRKPKHLNHHVMNYIHGTVLLLFYCGKCQKVYEKHRNG